jgi:hypothetical protein
MAEFQRIHASEFKQCYVGVFVVLVFVVLVA